MDRDGVASSRSRTLHGHAALRAAVDWFGPHVERPENLRGVSARNDHANREAILAFLADLKVRGSRRVYRQKDPFDETQESFPLATARFRPLVGDPDIDGDGGVFGFGPWGISLEGVRIRMSATGVLELGDRWGDSAIFGSHADAPFDDTVWVTDEWDLPAPVPPLHVPAHAVERFAPHAAAIAANVLALYPTDRAAADAAIATHLKACRPWSDPPPVIWFESPGAALDALNASKSDYGDPRRDLRDRPLSEFDQETIVRLNGSAAASRHAVWNNGRGTAVRDAVWRLTGSSVGYDTEDAIRDLMVARGVRKGFHYLGLVADHENLAFYHFLRANGADLPAVATTFCAMTSSVWLMFPAPHMIYAVDRPVAAVKDEAEILLLFSDQERLSLPLSAKD